MAGQRVVVDTDFIGGITEYQAGDGADLFRRVFRTLNMHPVVHPFVAENELMHNTVAQSLIKSEDLVVIPYNEFLPETEARKSLYRKSFQDIYKIIQEEYIPRRGSAKLAPLTSNDDIFIRHAGRSFGEVHSILMAVELGIPLFYSNDIGAKTAASRYGPGRLIVQNAEEIAELLKIEGSEVNGEERRFIKHYYTRNTRK